MNSRERVLAAVRHQQPDRVPVGVGLCPEILGKLRAHLALPDDEAVWAWTGHDFSWVGPRFRHPASDIGYADPTIEVTADGLYLDIFRVPFKVVQTEFQRYVDIAGRPPLKAAQTLVDIARFPWPDAADWDYSTIADRLGACRRASIGHSRGFFEISHFVRGMDEFLMDLAMDEPMAHAVMDHIIAFLLEKVRRTFEAAGQGGYAVFEYNDDVASQRALFISPEMWRRDIKPRMAKFCEMYHRFGAVVRYHSCGSVRSIIPDLIEIGVDILNPVQPLAAGMDPFELKREFGPHLTLDGGMDIQDFLIHASPAQVRDHTKRMIEVLGRDGGFILSGSHTLQADTPVENVVAMFEAAR
jgi:uroporphyrinogen decarboxylase